MGYESSLDDRDFSSSEYQAAKAEHQKVVDTWAVKRLALEAECLHGNETFTPAQMRRAV